MTFYLALAGAVLGALHTILHLIGTKSPTAEKLADDVDAVGAVVPHA